MTAQYIQPEVAAIMPKVVDQILRALGESVDRIVLHGSAIKEGAFRTGESDIDVVVMLKPDHTVSFRDQINVQRLIESALDIESCTHIEINYMTAERVYRYKNFKLCYQGGVAHGVIFFDSGRIDDNICTAAALTMEEARQEISHHYLQQSWIWLGEAHPLLHRSTWSASRAACRALHSVLVTHDFDVAPKLIRWHLPVLFDAACRFNPALSQLSSSVGAVPPDLASFDLVDYDEATPELSIQARRQVIAQAMRIARHVERILGRKVSHARHPPFHAKHYKEGCHG